MSDDRERVRSRVDLVDLIGQRVTLKKTGRTWKGLCPFHDDKNPSFTVNPDLGRYKCWSCGAQGDAFNWVMETQKMEFREALQFLADLVNVTLTRSVGERTDPSKRDSQDAAMTSALIFFRQEFGRSTEVQAYCDQRGLAKEIIEEWELGFAPDINGALATQLKKQGHDLAMCRDLFLVEKDTTGGYFDKFRSRLMVPIRDDRGRLVAFGGRIIGSGQPKYINSSETPIFHKSQVLFGMHRARDTMSKSGVGVLVEGYFDVVACHRAGVTNAVAPMGTSLTDDQVRMLGRWCKTVVLLLDGDEAGQKAAERSADLLEAAGIDVRVAVVQPGDDPDTLRERDGDGAVRRVVDEAIPALAFRLRRVETLLKPETDEYWQTVAGLIARAPTALEKNRWVQEYAPKYPGLKDPIEAKRALQSMVQSAIKRRGKANTRRDTSTGPNLGLRAAEVVLWLGVIDSATRGVADPVLRQPELMESSLGERFALAYARSFPTEPPNGPLSDWLHAIEDEDLKSALTLLSERDRAPERAISGAGDELKRKLELRSLREAEQLTNADDEELRLILSKNQMLKGKDEPKPEAEKDEFA
ncbi:MAG: DNA primase [Fimbriimonadaceae bacterium]|nr:DNA primase [Fimbriimonadaceae bacterium]